MTVENPEVTGLSRLVCAFNHRIFGKNHPALLLDIVGSRAQANATGSKQNDAHRAVVVNLILKLLRDVKGGQLALVTPYRSQRDEYRGDLVKAARKNPTLRGELLQIFATTIDGFQGGERMICIVDLTCSDHIGFLKSAHRLTVAISRAMGGMYVVANVEAMASDPISCRTNSYVT
jgi:superfamily I DNA and/or RNA helicase